MKEELQDKLERLRALLRETGGCAVAFSGGVDSTLLMKLAAEELGDRAIAVTAASSSFPERERHEAAAFCKNNKIRHCVVETDELSVEGFRDNQPDRCYRCKKHIFSSLIRLAEENGLSCVAEGSNMDDLGDYRPGLVAIRELGVRSPLREAGLTKAEIREISQELGLPTWSKPSFACLASRFPYGEEITGEKLRMVDLAEQFLQDLGLHQLRVRIHGTVARIEVLPEHIAELACEPVRTRIAEALKSFGFSYVALDLVGYRTGSMNEVLTAEVKAANTLPDAAGGGAR